MNTEEISAFNRFTTPSVNHPGRIAGAVSVLTVIGDILSVFVIMATMMMAVSVTMHLFSRERISFRDLVVPECDLYAKGVRKREKLRRCEIKRCTRLEMLEGNLGNTAAPRDFDVITRVRFSGFICFEFHLIASLRDGHAVVQDLGDDAEDLELPAIRNGQGFFAQELFFTGGRKTAFRFEHSIRVDREIEASCIHRGKRALERFLQKWFHIQVVDGPFQKYRILDAKLFEKLGVDVRRLRFNAEYLGLWYRDLDFRIAFEADIAWHMRPPFLSLITLSKKLSTL